MGRTLGKPAEAGVPEIMKQDSGFWPALVLGGFLFVYQLGAVPLFDLDEAIYAETAREMIESGDWLTPQFNYAPDFDKPVLLYWLMAGAMMTFGPSEFSARLPSSIFGVLLLLVTYGLMRILRGPRAGILAMIILASSLEMIALSHAALTDMVLVFFITSALACFYLVMDTNRGFLVMGLYSALALAVLTKGPVGLVLPALIMAVFLLSVGRLREGIRRLHLGWGTVIFAAIVIPWYGLMFHLHGRAFWNSFFMRHNIERFTSVIGGHAGAPFYYLAVIAVGFFPWVAFLPASIISAIPRLNNAGGWKRLRTLPSQNPFEWFMILWTVAVVGFFTLAGTKLPHYIAPAFPAMALLVAGWWDRRLDQTDFNIQREERYSFGLLGLLTVVLAALLLAVPRLIEWARIRYATSAPFLIQPIDLDWSLMILSVILLSGVMTFTAFYMVARRWTAFMVLVLTIGVFSSVMLGQLIPSVSSYIQIPLRDLAGQTGGWIHPEEPLVLYGLKKPSVLFYAGRGAVLFKKNQEDEMRSYLKAHARALVLSPLPLAPVLNRIPGVVIREEKGGYILATTF
jgi:4-amino-4-deoxy-L-arabinose transferase-like glycosyltransferase